MKDKILCQAGIHIFFLKGSIAIIVFLITAVVLQQLQGLAVQESKLMEEKAVAQAHVDFYKEQNSLDIADKLKQKIALAKLEAIRNSIRTNKSLLDLNRELTKTCWLLSILSFVLGVVFWWLHIPYVQVPSSVNQRDETDAEVFSVTVSSKETQQYSISVKRT